MSQFSHLYNNTRWRNRRLAQLRAQPLCSLCLAKGIVMAASVADHVEPHRGDPYLFWNGKLQSLCSDCHNSTKQQIEARGYSREIGIDGWPVDPNHPANKGGGGGA